MDELSQNQSLIVIVLITYNGQDDIGDFLKTYAAYTPSYAQFVVVDNGSKDATLAIIERENPKAVIIRNDENRGYAGGARQGMEYALSHGAAAVCVVNQDLRFTAHWLEPLVDTFARQPTCAAVQPRIVLYPDSTRINSYGNAIHYLGFGYTLGYRGHIRAYECLEGVPLASCSGAAILFRCAALRTVGLIDERFFMYYEDSDLCWRLRLAGYTLGLCCASLVMHRYEFSRSIGKFYYMERNRIIMMFKNYSARSLFLIAPMFFFMEAGMVAYSAWMTLWGKRNSLTLFEKVRSYAFFLSPRSWYYLYRERKKTQKIRSVPDEHIVELFRDSIEFQDIDNPILRRIVNPMMRSYWMFIKRII